MFSFYNRVIVGNLTYWGDSFFILIFDLFRLIPFMCKVFKIEVNHEKLTDEIVEPKINYENHSDVAIVKVKTYDGRIWSRAADVHVLENGRNRGIIGELTKGVRKNPEADFQNFGIIEHSVKFVGTFKCFSQGVLNCDVIAKKIIIYGGYFNGDLIADEIIIYGGVFNGTIVSKNPPQIYGGDFSDCKGLYFNLPSAPIKEIEDIKWLISNYANIEIRSLEKFEGKFIDDIFPSKELIQAIHEINAMLFGLYCTVKVLQNKVQSSEYSKDIYSVIDTATDSIEQIIRLLQSINEKNAKNMQVDCWSIFLKVMDKIHYCKLDTKGLVDDIRNDIESFDPGDSFNAMEIDKKMYDSILEGLLRFREYLKTVGKKSPKSKAYKKLKIIDEKIHTKFVNNLQDCLALLDEADIIYCNYVTRSNRVKKSRKRTSKTQEVTRTTVVEIVEESLESSSEETSAFLAEVVNDDSEVIEEVEVEDVLSLESESIEGEDSSVKDDSSDDEFTFEVDDASEDDEDNFDY